MIVSKCALRLLCVGALALPFSGCCPSIPGGPKEIEFEIAPGVKERVPNGSYFWEWKAYEKCVEEVSFFAFGLWANYSSAAHAGYRQEPRDAPPASDPMQQPGTPPRPPPR